LDFFVIHTFIESVKRNLPMPIVVYDAATQSAITPLSGQSIELGHQTVEFHDFAGGSSPRWRYSVFKYDF
jgi:hypothetical protein